jgi:hypothetical protein
LGTLLLAAAQFLQAPTWLAGLVRLLALLGYQGAADTQERAEGHDQAATCLQQRCMQMSICMHTWDLAVLMLDVLLHISLAMCMPCISELKLQCLL